MQLYSSEVLEYMNQLSVSLKETYAGLGTDEEYIPAKGEVCVAKYTADQVTSHQASSSVSRLSPRRLYPLMDPRALSHA